MPLFDSLFDSLFHRRANDHFPRLRDLLKDAPHLTIADAERALDGLHRMISIDIASVYTSAGSNHTRWQVWLDITRRRLTLAEWADEWLAKHPAMREEA